jgi:hypothetical protein
MPASHSYFTSLYDEFTDEMVLLTDELSSTYYDNKPINPNGKADSLNFISHVRHSTNDPRVETTKLTATGLPSTAKDSIERLRYLDGDAGKAFSLFFNWREIQHRRDGFCAPILDSMHEGNLCSTSLDIHNIMGDLKITRTTSRRPSMAKKQGEGINVLNLPSRQGAGMLDGLNKRIRNGFITPSNESFNSADQSQIELRILAHESQDPLLLDIYRNNGDIHATTASNMFNIPIDELDDARHRKPAKNVNFMISYGGAGHKLWTIYRQNNINEYDERQCQKFIDGWYSLYSGVAEWKERVLYQARQCGYVSTWSGMRRCLPNLWSSDNRQRAQAEREAISHIIQGTAQDIIQRSMGWVYNEILKLREAGVDAWLALQLYDELIHRVEEDYVELVDEIVLEGLVKHHGYRGFSVPILADSSSGKCWGEL